MISHRYQYQPPPTVSGLQTHAVDGRKCHKRSDMSWNIKIKNKENYDDDDDDELMQFDVDNRVINLPL